MRLKVIDVSASVKLLLGYVVSSFVSSLPTRPVVPKVVDYSLLCGVSLRTDQRNRFTRARSIISSPRPLRTAFAMNKPKPFACSKLIVGGIESS
jgi:hypothetical protein